MVHITICKTYTNTNLKLEFESEHAVVLLPSNKRLYTNGHRRCGRIYYELCMSQQVTCLTLVECLQYFAVWNTAISKKSTEKYALHKTHIPSLVCLVITSGVIFKPMGSETIHSIRYWTRKQPADYLPAVLLTCILLKCSMSPSDIRNLVQLLLVKLSNILMWVLNCLIPHIRHHPTCFKV